MGPDHPFLRQFLQNNDNGPGGALGQGGFGQGPFGRRGFGPEQFVDGRIGGHHGPHALAWAIFAILLVLLLLTVANLVFSILAARRRGERWRPGPAFGYGQWGPPGRPREGKALAILQHRYARGEMSRDDYLKARADLGAPPEAAGEAPTEETAPPVPPAA